MAAVPRPFSAKTKVEQLQIMRKPTWLRATLIVVTCPYDNFDPVLFKADMKCACSIVSSHVINLVTKVPGVIECCTRMTRPSRTSPVSKLYVAIGKVAMIQNGPNDVPFDSDTVIQFVSNCIHMQCTCPTDEPPVKLVDVPPPQKVLPGKRRKIFAPPSPSAHRAGGDCVRIPEKCIDLCGDDIENQMAVTFTSSIAPCDEYRWTTKRMTEVVSSYLNKHGYNGVTICVALLPRSNYSNLDPYEDYYRIIVWRHRERNPVTRTPYPGLPSRKLLMSALCTYNVCVEASHTDCIARGDKVSTIPRRVMGLQSRRCMAALVHEGQDVASLLWLDE